MSCSLGQQVDDLALGFVAPLQTDNASAGHGGPFSCGQYWRATQGFYEGVLRMVNLGWVGKGQYWR